MDPRTLDAIREEEVIEVVIDDYGFTGEGYVRLDDGFLSVPGALPGEEVRVRVESGEAYGGRLFASLEEVLSASPVRRDPLCGRDAICRGCQLRHATVDEELGFHVRTVEEVVEKFGGIERGRHPPVEIVTPQPISRGDAFRVRSSLTYQVRSGKPELGLRSPVQDALVPMFDCPALTTPVRRVVKTLEQVLAGLDELPADHQMARDALARGEAAPVSVERVRVASPVIGRGLVDLVLGDTDGEGILEQAVAGGPVARLCEELEAALPEEVGLAVSVGERRAYLKEPRRLRLPLAGLRMEIGYEDWFPATLLPAEALYSRLLELLDLRADEAFLDVGSGIGTISLLAAKRTEKAVGIDINRHSVATAELNAMENGVANVAFEVGGWENVLRKLKLDDQVFDVATINPMREPLGRRPLTYLKALGVERLVYLAPSPASGAKDIAELRDMGWKLDWLGAANIHPATYHTMLLARMRR